MSTETRTRVLVDSAIRRSVGVLVPDDLAEPRSDLDDPERLFATVWSARDERNARWTPPLVELAGGPYAFTKEAWEALKLGIEQAWGVFEATWPAGSDQG